MQTETKESELDKVKKQIASNPDAVNNKNSVGGTPLHFYTQNAKNLKENPAASAENLAIVKLLIQANADVNAVDKNSLTPLHYAISANDEALVDTLLKAGAKVNANHDYAATFFLLAFLNKNLNMVEKLRSYGIEELIVIRAIEYALKEKDYDQTWLKDIPIANPQEAISIAIAYRNIELIDFLLDKNTEIKPTKEQTEKINFLRNINAVQMKIKDNPLPTAVSRFFYTSKAKAFHREKKAAIQKKGALLSPEKNQKLTVSQAMLSQTYYEEGDEAKRNALKEIMAKKISEYSDYSQAPLIAPFLYLVALNAVIGRDSAISKSANSLERKPLKVMISGDNHVTNSHSILKPNDRCLGLYTHKNSLFSTFGPYSHTNQTIATIFHEGSHFAADEVKKNQSEPYGEWDFFAEQRYQKIVTDIHLQSKNWLAKNDNEAIVIKNFQGIFSNYSASAYGKELFVHIAETIAILGYADGMDWLNQNVPELVKFYVEEFNPACMQYLKHREVGNYLVLDSALSEALNATKSVSAGFIPEKSQVLIAAAVVLLLLLGGSTAGLGFLAVGAAIIAAGALIGLVGAAMVGKSIYDRPTLKPAMEDQPPDDRRKNWVSAPNTDSTRESNPSADEATNPTTPKYEQTNELSDDSTPRP